MWMCLQKLTSNILLNTTKSMVLVFFCYNQLRQRGEEKRRLAGFQAGNLFQALEMGWRNVSAPPKLRTAHGKPQQRVVVSNKLAHSNYFPSVNKQVCWHVCASHVQYRKLNIYYDHEDTSTHRNTIHNANTTTSHHTTSTSTFTAGNQNPKQRPKAFHYSARSRDR